METNSKVFCPWCGSEMQLEEALPFSRIYAYVCECGAVSPNESGKEQAYAAAIHRPLQKPLTLEEVQERVAVWLETTELIPVLFIDEHSDNMDSVLMDEYNNYFDDKNKLYGATWRCWATKPTDEERKAAKWDDMGGKQNDELD